jgi:Uncharacterized protein conserved in bacteria
MPATAQEVARTAGVGEKGGQTRSRRKAGTTKRARRLRQAGNEAEALLWLELKRSRLGECKFTRQYPIGPYFADFVCRQKKLVVEKDGSQHADSAYDRRRDEFKRAQGYSVLRFWNADVLRHRTQVCETILAALYSRMTEDIAAPDMRFIHKPESKPSHGDITL